MLTQVVLFDGFDPLDVVAPYEVLAAAGIEAELVSAEGAREVPSGLNLLSLRAVAALDPQRADLVLVPGVAGPVEEIPAMLAQVANGLAAVLKEALELPETTVATVCGGSLVLAVAGLIRGRRATSHHWGLGLLAESGVEAIDARVVDDGDLVSGAGVTSGLDLALHLVERELGAPKAHEVEQFFAHERRGIVWRAS